MVNAAGGDRVSVSNLFPSSVDIDAIEPGIGIIRSVSGSGLSQSITYTCDYVFRGDVFTNVAGQIPMFDRWPAPLLVRALRPNMAFPAYTIRGETGAVIQPFMPAEIADFGPCAPGSQSDGAIRTIIDALRSMTELQKKQVREALNL